MIIRMLQVWILSKPPTSSNKHWKTVSFLSQAEVISSAFKTKVPHSDLYFWLHQWLTEPNLGLLTQRAAKPIYWYWVVAKKSVKLFNYIQLFGNPMDCSPTGSSVHGILQARGLEWVAISFLQGIFPIQGSNLRLLHCWQILYHLSHKSILHLVQSQAVRTGSSCLKDLNFPLALRQGFKSNVWDESYRMCAQFVDFLLVGWWWRDRVMHQECQSSGSNQTGVYVLMVSILCLGVYVGVLVSTEQLKDTLCTSLEEELQTRCYHSTIV